MTYDIESKLADLVVPSTFFPRVDTVNIFYSLFWRTELTSLILEYSMLRSARNH